MRKNSYSYAADFIWKFTGLTLSATSCVAQNVPYSLFITMRLKIYCSIFHFVLCDWHYCYWSFLVDFFYVDYNLAYFHLFYVG